MAAPLVITEAEYLALDSGGEDKHELIGGEIVAMAGGSPQHSRIPQILTALLERRLPRSCRTYNADLRTRYDAINYVYPDLTILCGKPLLFGDHSLLNPTAVVEVLSPSTRDKDWGAKRIIYDRIASIQHILYLEQNEARGELGTRLPDGNWRWEQLDGLDAVANLRHFGVELILKEVFAEVLDPD